MTVFQRLSGLAALGNANPSSSQARGKNPAAADGISNLQNQINQLLKLLKDFAEEVSGGGSGSGSGGSSKYAPATGSLPITTTYQDVPGVSVTLDKAGTWVIIASIEAALESNISAQILVGGAARPGIIFCSCPSGTLGTTGHFCRSWEIQGSIGSIVKLQGKKTGAPGSNLIGANSQLTAIFIKA